MGSNPDLAIRLFHGDADNTIPYENSQAFADVLEQAGYDVLLTEFHGGHGVPSEISLPAFVALAEE